MFSRAGQLGQNAPKPSAKTAGAQNPVLQTSGHILCAYAIIAMVWSESYPICEDQSVHHRGYPTGELPLSVCVPLCCKTRYKQVSKKTRSKCYVRDNLRLPGARKPGQTAQVDPGGLSLTLEGHTSKLATELFVPLTLRECAKGLGASSVCLRLWEGSFKQHRHHSTSVADAKRQVPKVIVNISDLLNSSWEPKKSFNCKDTSEDFPRLL